MTDRRVLWIVAGVLIGAAAVWVQNWWTLAAMVILVAGQLGAVSGDGGEAAPDGAE